MAGEKQWTFGTPTPDGSESIHVHTPVPTPAGNGKTTVKCSQCGASLPK